MAGALILFCFLFVGCTEKKMDDVPTENQTIRVNAASSDEPIVSYGSATNVVIFICFSDEDPATVRASIPADFRDRCNGTDNSIKDYYDKLSYGKFSFYSLFPSYDNGSFYIYRDGHPRSYYTNNSSSTGSGRTGPESALLNNAVYEASAYLDLNGRILDVNGDGYVDCVTFLISGNYSESNWNKIMWPHSWQLDDITKEYNASSASASIAGKKVNDYTFLFLDTISSRIGLMCHELGHAVGDLPDLYHYKSGYSQYLPVGYWDLMHLDCATPQYMTTYLRQKYLSFAEGNQIREMEKSGDYTLTPVTTTDKNSVLAYTLTIDNGTATPNESIWIEYRRNDVSTYDSDLPGSGLIVYRVNNTSYPDGNKNARYQTDKYPDEVYVFRPDVSQKSATSDKEKENLSYAYVSLQNEKFSSLGNATSTIKYDPRCIYLSNGKNTGIVLTVKEESKEKVTFHIELGDYDSSEIDYAASYVQGNTASKNKVEIYYGEDIKSKINLYVKRKNRGIYRADDSSFVLLGGDDLYEICEDGKNAYLQYTDDFGTYRFSYLLVIHDKLLENKDDYSAVILSLPEKTEYVVGETFSLRGLIVQATYLSGVRNFVYSTENAMLWQAIGHDLEKSGEQEVTVTYNEEIRIHFTIFVHSDVVSLRVEEKNTRHISGDTVQPCYNVVATYADGLQKTLAEGDYSIESDTETAYGKTNVTFRSVDNGEVSCRSYYYYVPQRITSISLVADPKKTYRYGEPLDLSEGRIQVSFGTYPNGFSLDGDNVLSLDNYYAYFTGYSPTKVGKQTIKLALEDALLSIDVNVLPMPDALLSVSDKTIRVSESASMILLDEDHTLKQLSESISCYLDVSYTYTVGKDTFSITVDRYAELRLQSDVKIQLTNGSGVVIKEYIVRRSGDGNDDGTVDEKDMPYWERAVTSKEEVSKGVLFDKNGDNKFTLTDYVILMDEIKEAR